MQVAPVQLKNGYKNNTTCKSSAMNDIIWLVQGGIYHKHSLCKYRGKSSCVGSTGAFILVFLFLSYY